MERLLVGVDGSAEAGDALRWSADVARRTGLELIAARVFATTQSELTPTIDAELHERQRREVEQWCGQVDTGGTTTALLLDGDPPDALLGAAVDWDAGLIVVGGRGAGRLAHLDPSTVSGRLAHTTTLPLAVVPHTGAEALGQIVLGVDGSPGSLAAVDFVADLAARLGVGATAVLAYEPFAEFVPETDERSWRHEAERAVGRWVAPLTAAGVAVDVDVDRDVHPGAAIERALKAHPGSVACVGARKLSDVTGLRVAHTPLEMLDHTGAAVILVPPKPSD